SVLGRARLGVADRARLGVLTAPGSASRRPFATLLYITCIIERYELAGKPRREPTAQRRRGQRRSSSPMLAGCNALPIPGLLGDTAVGRGPDCGFCLSGLRPRPRCSPRVAPPARVRTPRLDPPPRSPRAGRNRKPPPRRGSPGVEVSRLRPLGLASRHPNPPNGWIPRAATRSGWRQTAAPS